MSAYKMIKNLSPCEMCGKHDRLTDILIEGSVLSVCKNCIKFGTIIKKPSLSEIPRRIKKEIKTEEEKEFINPEYSSIIKKAREKLNLKQEDLAKMVSERESTIRKLEQNHMKPTFSLAKKLEQYLKINLIESNLPKEDIKETKINFSDSALTIGDLLKLKKK